MKGPYLAPLLLVLAVTGAQGEIIGVTGGTAAPPATLGPYQMTPFPADDRPVWEDVTFVPSPLGGEVVFSVPMSHRTVTQGWGGWSHGYTGDLYYTPGEAQVTLGLPPETRAFYLYATHDLDSPREIVATTDDGTSVIQWVDTWYEAAYFGFYADNPADTIGSITVTSPAGLAIGEFGIAIPEPSSLLLLSAALLAVPRRRPAR